MRVTSGFQLLCSFKVQLKVKFTEICFCLVVDNLANKSLTVQIVSHVQITKSTANYDESETLRRVVLLPSAVG